MSSVRLLLLRPRLARLSLLLPIKLPGARSRHNLLGESFDIVLEILRFNLNPTAKHEPQVTNLVGDSGEPRHVVLNVVTQTNLHLGVIASSLYSETQGRSTLRHCISDSAGEVRAKGHQLQHWLGVEIRQENLHLTEHPRVDLAILIKRRSHSRAQMDLLNRQLIYKKLGEHFGLTAPAPALQKVGKKTHEHRNYYGSSRRHRRDRIPVPGSHRGLSYFHNHTHSLIPLLTGRHSAMTPIEEVLSDG